MCGTGCFLRRIKRGGVVAVAESLVRHLDLICDAAVVQDDLNVSGIVEITAFPLAGGGYPRKLIVNHQHIAVQRTRRSL